VSKLIGSPPGYGGYEEGGQLMGRVKRAPYSIVLLEERGRYQISELSVLGRDLQIDRSIAGHHATRHKASVARASCLLRSGLMASSSTDRSSRLT